jgi:hypothetical protein
LQLRGLGGGGAGWVFDVLDRDPAVEHLVLAPEMPVRVPHRPGHQVGVPVGELTRETLRDMVNRETFGIGGRDDVVNHAN